MIKDTKTSNAKLVILAHPFWVASHSRVQEVKPHHVSLRPSFYFGDKEDEKTIGWK